MAIGDVDSNGFADLIIVNDPQDHFQVHYYDPQKRSYDEKSMAVFLGNNTKITNIALSKNQEILQALFVVFERTDKDPEKNGTFLKVFQQAAWHEKNMDKGQFKENYNSHANNWQLYPNSQPMFFDINGDMK